MKKTTLLSLALILCVTSLSGCTRTSYAIDSKDGKTIISDGKPQLDSATGLLGYTDANGKKQQINQYDVKEITALPK